MDITDAQVHVWAKDTPDRPWTSGGHEFAHTDEYRVDQLIAEMDAAGVGRGVLVPAAYEGDRNDVCLAAAAAHPDRFRVMGRIPIAGAFDRDSLSEWRRQPGMLGLRITFALGATAHHLIDGEAEWIWPIAQEAGIPIMIYAPGQLPHVRRVAESYPGLKLAIDHLGLRPGQVDTEIDPVLDELRGLADLPNVTVKATALPRHVSEPYPFASLHDRISRVIDAFSPHRVFWGSDLTGLNCTYADAIRLFTDAMGLSTKEQSVVMDLGIRDWLGWSAHPREVALP